MPLSLKTTTYTAALFVALVLGVLLLLGSRQYRSYKDYDRIIDQNEKIVFQFATIREHINESLLEGRLHQLKDITAEVEALNTNLARILEEQLIPAEYKLSFAGQVDLAGIILLLRNIGTDNENLLKIRQLNQEIRVLNDRLLLFDRVIVNHVKKKLVGFQSVVIGILAIVVFAVIYILVFWHHQVAVPLLDLRKQIRQVFQGRRTEVTPLRKSGEIAELAGAFHDLLLQQALSSRKSSRHGSLLTSTQKIAELSSQSATSEKIFTETCRSLLANEDYCLVWLGVPGPDDRLTATATDASTTMSRQECDECMNVLLTASKNAPEQDAATLALKKRQPVVIKDALRQIPKGHLKNTPFADGYANCCAVPLLLGQTVYGVLTVYSPAPQSFSEEEISLLNTMAHEVALALFALETKTALTREQAVSRQLDSGFQVMQVIISRTGAIVSMNRPAAAALGLSDRPPAGLQWHTLLPEPEQKFHGLACQRLLDGKGTNSDLTEMTLLSKTGETHSIRYQYAVLPASADGDGAILWLGLDITKPAVWLNRAQTVHRAVREQFFAASPALFLSLRADGTIEEVNPALQKLLATSSELLVGKNVLQVLCRESSPPAALTAALTAAGGEATVHLDALTGEFRVRIIPVAGNTKEDNRLLMIAENISEEQRLHADLIKAARLAAMGELTVGVANEINNLSNGLINYTQILSEEIESAAGENKAPLELLQNVIRDGERISHIVQQILLFNANRTQLIETVHIEKVIDDSMAMIANLLKQDGIHATLSFPAALPAIRINVQQMQHVFLALLSNARYALNLRYSGAHANKRMEITGEVTDKAGKQWVRISCADFGAGIPTHVIPRIFEPFFSTKPPGDGTGLGLSIAQALVQENKGALQVESMINDHTTIMIELPIS